MLRANKTLRSLNLESNFITGAGVQAVVDALRDNDTLTEIKIDNQVPDDLWHTPPSEIITAVYLTEFIKC